MSLKNPIFRKFSYTAPFDNAVKMVIDGTQYYITRKDLNDSYVLDRFANCYLLYILFHSYVSYLIADSQVELGIIGGLNLLSFIATKEYLTPLVVLSLFSHLCLGVVFFIRAMTDGNASQFICYFVHIGANQYMFSFYTD